MEDFDEKLERVVNEAIPDTDNCRNVSYPSDFRDAIMDVYGCMWSMRDPTEKNVEIFKDILLEQYQEWDEEDYDEDEDGNCSHCHLDDDATPEQIASVQKWLELIEADLLYVARYVMENMHDKNHD